MSSFYEFIFNFIHNMLSFLSFGKKKITNSLNIYIKTNTNQTLSIDIDKKCDIKNVKEMVASELGVEWDDVKIIFAGKELCDSTKIEECDLGQKSILHAVKTHNKPKALVKPSLDSILLEESIEEQEPSKPLCETLVDLQLEANERENLPDEDREKNKAQFFVHCSQCNDMCPGKLRVRCSVCQGGALTVHRDPECWDDVLQSKRITGHCESSQKACVENEMGDPPFAEFYFKCSQHPSEGEKDFAAPLNLVKRNMRNVRCLACTDVCDPILVFPCGHVTCVECFRNYCLSRLMERKFISDPIVGYTLACPTGCEKSLIIEIHHFKLMSKEQYDRYQRFATEEFVIKSGGVLCPQPDCGMGLLVDADCTRVQCQNGCGFVFCKNCLQGFHLGECLPESGPSSSTENNLYLISPERAAEAIWDEASKVTIKVISKPCPKCRTPTERSGGCMHMVCTRAGCDFEWCWVCQTEWNRDCMGAHWFG